MEISKIVVACLVGYFIGSISFSRIFVRVLAPSADLSKVTFPVPGVTQPMRLSDIGANRAATLLGSKLGVVIGILDIIKAFIPTLFFRFLYPAESYYLFVAVFAVAGHNWPIYYGFKGGRGISPTIGGLLAIDWAGGLICAISAMIIALFILRNYGLMFPLTMLLLIPWLWFSTNEPLHLLYAIAVNVFFIITFVPDIPEFRRALKEKGAPVSNQEMMETNPMGRAMLRLGRRLKIIR